MRAARWSAVAALALTALVSLSASAQDRPGGPPPRGGARDSLESRIQMRMAQVLRTQVGMTDEQIRRYQATNRKFEPQRRALFTEERDVRMSLRSAIESGDTTQQARVGQLLDRTLQLQRQRIDLQEAEQKEFATFLSPVQRARLFGLEEQLRRRMADLREGGGPPPRGPLRGPRPGGMRPPP